MLGVRFEDVTKVFDGGSVALDHVDLTVEAGELVGLVGPSGCGKTTALRILGGLETPTSGRVVAGGRDITDVPVHARRFGLITQQTQLMSHRSARGNIRFPLEMRDPRGDEGPYEERLWAEAANLGIEHLLDEKPQRLSEGQRRLIQLARVVVGRPNVVLLDEPLAHLEDQVRLRLRAEIVRLHRERGLTSLLATASQHDAMAMCDRLAVLFGGVIDQVGTPADVFDRPATGRVAAFFGEPAMNLLPAAVDVSGGERTLTVLGVRLRVWTPEVDAYHGRTVHVGFRPDDVVVGVPADTGVEVDVAAIEPVGHETLVHATTRHGVRISCVVPGRPPPIGTTLDLGIPAERLHLFDPATEFAIYHPPPRR